MLSEYKKTIVAVVGAIVTILATQGIDVDPGISAAFTTLATAVAVWYFRNDPTI